MIRTGASRQIVLLTLVWLGLALVVLLVPSPREWGDFGHRISPYYDRISFFFQPAVHVILMAGLATACMHHFRNRNVLFAFALSFVLVMLVAALLEGLQSLLPREFSRRCDVADLAPGAVGAMLGCFVGMLWRPAKPKDG